MKIIITLKLILKTFLCVAFLSQCTSQKNVISSDIDFDKLFIGHFPMSFKNVIISSGIVDKWNTSEVESKYVTGEGGMGMSTFTFRGHIKGQEAYYFITIPSQESSDFDACAEVMVDSINIQTKKDSVLYVLKAGIYTKIILGD